MITSSPTPNAALVVLAYALACALPCAPALTAQAPIALSLGGAARLAAEWNAAPSAAKQRVAQADARVRQRRAEFLPNFSIAASDAERTFNSASMGISFRDANTGKFLFDPNGQVLGPVRSWDLRGTLQQRIFDFGAFARLHAAQASAGMVTAEATVAAQQAAGIAATAYVRAARADAQLGARVADSTLAAELLGIARDQLSAGVGIALDVTRAQSQLASARAQLIGARNERNRARLELNRALGMPADQVVILSDSLAGLATDLAVPTTDAAVDVALQGRADLRAAVEASKAAERQVDALRAERLPTLGLYADQGSNGKGIQHLIPTYNWGISLSIPVFDGFRREGRIDEQRAVVRELGIRRRDLNDQAANDVRGALLDLASAREQLAANAERLQLAEQELAQARDRFTAGVAGNADVISASLGLNLARTQMVDARAAFQSARVALARAQGTVTALP
jgi:outer membrane protein